MVAFMKERNERGIKARLCPDQHDALYAYVHVKDLRQSIEQLFPNAMSIKVPKINMQLKYDIGIYLRLGEKPTEEALILHGVEPELAGRYTNDF